MQYKKGVTVILFKEMGSDVV